MGSATRVKGEKMSEWVKITKRPMDEEERQEWSERLGFDIEYEEAVIYSNLPDDGDRVLVCHENGFIEIDTFRDEYEGCYFEENGEIDGIIAWMPLPAPYTERSEDAEIH